MAGEERVRQIVASSKCDICDQCYEEDNIQILGYVGETWILQVFCRACHSQKLLAAAINESESFKAAAKEYITDLKTAEREKFEHVIITINDVLDMLIYLSNFNGSFSHLLKD